MKSTNEIHKEIRKALKKEFPDCKFSVIKQESSMSVESTIALMSGPFETVREESEHWNGEYIQLNKYQLLDEYRQNTICNGANLTDEAWEVMSRVAHIAMEINPGYGEKYGEFLSLHIGKWNKPYQVKES